MHIPKAGGKVRAGSYDGCRVMGDGCRKPYLSRRRGYAGQGRVHFRGLLHATWRAPKSPQL